jgi:hypothetical protein
VENEGSKAVGWADAMNGIGSMEILGHRFMPPGRAMLLVMHREGPMMQWPEVVAIFNLLNAMDDASLCVGEMK